MGGHESLCSSKQRKQRSACGMAWPDRGAAAAQQRPCVPLFQACHPHAPPCLQDIRQDYEGGYVLIAVEHADAPAPDWHRELFAGGA